MTHQKKLYTSLFVLGLFILIFFLKERFTVGLYQDEFHYLPTAVFFSKEPLPSLDLLKSYNELNTPIPFILGGWVVKIFGDNIQFLRLLTFITSFGLLMLFIWNSPANSRRFWLCLAGLMIFPNYYLVSVYYYTDIFAMIFTLAGVIGYVRKAHWVGMLCFVGAICCRQYMLAFPVAVVAFEIINILKESGSISTFFSRIFTNRTWLFYAAATLSIVPWVLLWHGPAPAPVMAEQHYNSDKLVQYNFGFLIYSSVVVAVYYVIPEMLSTGKLRYLISFPRKYPLYFGLMLALVMVLIIFFPAKQAYNPYFTWPYLGYIDQLLMTIGISGFIKQIVFGLLMLVTLMRFFAPPLNLASWMVLVNILLLGKAQLSWDKYSLPLIMCLWFLTMFENHWRFSAEQQEITLAGNTK
ncbi:hypothetical protein [Dyadobacter luticola]|uniref:Glycosyltransferase RgtA/B/C/D-like domain-containing protein n=1 Tax=Dyadobacter luticola TaxID=1979387 RepID=A0A5R9KUY8_9BACT|nr:hypothetical protein [Dyadobacter luticola]TLV00092.1 hypothetical protein FEN17_11295 [Dyadobacter luticola]